MYFRYTDLKKVRLSMSRLLTVVNERKKIRSLFRAHLEDKYIQQKKQEEIQEIMKTKDKKYISKEDLNKTTDAGVYIKMKEEYKDR